MKYYDNVTSYFKNKASKYDLVDNQLYWKLSDAILYEILRKKILSRFYNQKSLNILDAGAGTGRWSFAIWEILKDKGFKLNFHLLDITKEMLDEANNKIDKAGTEDIMKTYLENIENLNEYQDDFYELGISFYNVLSFVESPKIALQEIYKKIKKGGVYASVVANLYHGYYFNILTGNIDELDKIHSDHMLRFNKDMPYIHCFSPIEIKKIYEDSGFTNVEVIGFPNFVYPNIEETYLEGQSENNKNILQMEDKFNSIMEIELKECFNSDLSSRGNALLVIGEKD